MKPDSHILENIYLLCLMRSGRSAKIVEANIEPFVRFSMDFVIFVAYSLATQTFFKCFGLGGGSVLISATDEEGILIA